MDEVRLRLLLRNFDLGQKHVVSKINQGGGLVLLWKSNFDISVVTSSLNHINAMINEGKENSWRFTRFYGYPKTLLSLGMSLNLSSSFLWLCARDFNEIIKSHEKLGGRARPKNQMKDLCEVLDECNFVDLGYIGPKFTWCKRIVGSITGWEWLDKVVANTECISLFLDSFIFHLEFAFSNYKPIIIHPEGIQS